jgi:hypothetical protein
LVSVLPKGGGPPGCEGVGTLWGARSPEGGSVGCRPVHSGLAV